ncbi:lysosomal acid lipase/cholesteryl ester hydrolase-like isoform X2, partial [Leptotrombidium deliense]
IRNPKVVQTIKPVLLVHGFFGDSTNFIINSPGNGTVGIIVFLTINNIGFALAMFGYEAWFLQCRGNIDSEKHKFFTINKTFQRNTNIGTQDEMSKYDLPATIAYILDVTKKRKDSAKILPLFKKVLLAKISYVGHSQGTTIALQLMASIPTYNKIDKAILLAPIA